MRADQVEMLLEDRRDLGLKKEVLAQLVHKYASLKKRLPDKKKSLRLTLNLALQSDFGEASTLCSPLSAASPFSFMDDYDISEMANSSFVFNQDSFVGLNAFFTNKRVYSADGYEVIRQNFNKLYNMHSRFGGARLNNSNQEVHISNVRQFYLDNHITYQLFMNLAVNSFNNKQWVDLGMFAVSIESLHSGLFDKTSFFYKEPNKEAKKRITIQKLLFFFCLVDFTQQSLGPPELRLAINMALNRNDKNLQTDKLVVWTLKKVQDSTGKSKQKVSFDEFYNVLLK